MRPDGVRDCQNLSGKRSLAAKNRQEIRRAPLAAKNCQEIRPSK